MDPDSTLESDMRSHLVLFAFASACSSGPSHVAKPAPTIVVVESGAEPRLRLHYDPEPGLVEKVETGTKLRVSNTSTNTTLDTGTTTADVPTIIMRGRLEVTGRSRSGDALVSYAIDDVSALDDLIDPRMRKAVEVIKREVKDARATWRLLPTGEVADVNLEAPNATTPPRELSNSVHHLFVRFPEADIGVGAIWQIEYQDTLSGVTWTQKTTYTLRALTDGQATVDVSVAMRAQPQDLSVEPNATTKLTSGEGTASGQAIVPRRGLVASGSSQSANEVNLLIVRGRLRVSSVLRTETFSSVKRIDNAAASQPAAPTI